MIIKAALLGAFLFVAACGGSPAVTPSRPTDGGLPTAGTQPTAGLPTTPAVPTLGGASLPPVPAPGGNTVSVTLTGGEDAGSYTGAGDPNCTSEIAGSGVWGVQYSVPELPADQLSSVQILWRPDSQGSDDDGFFPGVQVLFTVAFGPLFGEGYREYKVEVRTDDQDSEGSGTVEVNDAGSTATFHATGTTADGVTIDATVNCPSVLRGSGS